MSPLALGGGLAVKGGIIRAWTVGAFEPLTSALATLAISTLATSELADW